MGYGPTSTKKRIDKQAVYHAAMLLIQSNGQTTSLEVKTQLRSLGFFAEQAEVSGFLQELQTEHSWEKETVGTMHNQHFAYSTTTSKQAVAQPTQTTTPQPHVNTPLQNDVIQLIKDTVWNRSTAPSINVASVLQKELGLDHLNMIQIGLAIDAKYKTKTMKEDWSPILTVNDVVDMMLRLDPALNVSTSTPTFNAVLSPAYDGVRTVLSDKLGLLKSEILLSATMHDLEVDSLDLVEIAMELEMQFNIAIPDDALESVTTVDGLVKIIDGLIGGSSAPVQTSHAAQTSTPGTTIGASTAGNGKVKIPRKPKSVINDSVTPSTSPRVTVNIDPITHVNSAIAAKSGYDGNFWFAYVKNELEGYVYDGKYTSDNIRTVFARKKGVKIQDVRASRIHRM